MDFGHPQYIIVDHFLVAASCKPHRNQAVLWIATDIFGCAVCDRKTRTGYPALFPSRKKACSMPNIVFARSDCEENDVSRSEKHLNERAEERKEEEEENARNTHTVVANATIFEEKRGEEGVGITTENAPTAVPARDPAVTSGVGVSAAAMPKNPTTTINFSATGTTVVPAAAAAAAGENGEQKDPVAEEEEGKAPETVKQHSSIIQAERTDDESWDAKAGLGEAVGGWCCWRRNRRSDGGRV